LNTYNYSHYLSPPGLLVYIQVSSLESDGVGIETVPALIDTGADQTVLPSDLVDKLGLVAGDQVLIAGVSGAAEMAPTYFVDIALEHMQPMSMIVAAFGSKEYCYLGRDFLNRYRIVLDGPKLKFTIEE